MRKRISKYKHLHSNRFRYLSSSIPLICASGLLVISGMMLGGGTIVDRIAFADEPLVLDDLVPASDVMTLEENGGSTVELTVTNTNLYKPSTTDGVNYISTGLSVTALGVDNYGIYVQAADGNGNLTNGSTSLTGVGSNVATGGFGENTWGYSLADGEVAEGNLSTLTYNTVPASNPAAAKSGTVASDKPFTLAFAAKFADNANPGHYQGNVIVSVAANPGEIVEDLVEYPGIGFAGKIFMNDFTSEDCEAILDSEIGTQGTLIDKRNWNVYWISKLADGNCWMTQNLSYADPGGINAALSKWSSGAVTYRAYYTAEDSNTKYPGEDIQELEKEIDSTWTFTSSPYFVEASHYVATDGVSICDKEKGSWKGSVDSEYLPCRIYTTPRNVPYIHPEAKHQDYGTYYSWESATVGTGSLIASSGEMNAAESVCPANWRLPTSGKIENQPVGDFKKLINTYNVVSSAEGSSIMRAAPLYFIISGYVNASGEGKPLFQSQLGWYWSSTNKTSSVAYAMLVDGSRVEPAYDSYPKASGFSVRCLVSGQVEEAFTLSYEIRHPASDSAASISSASCTTSDGSCTVKLTTPSGGRCYNSHVYIFDGWSTSADSSSITYNGNETLTLNGDTTLYGVWTSSPAGCAID